MAVRTAMQMVTQMGSNWVHLTEICWAQLKVELKATSLVCWLDCSMAIQKAPMKEMYLVHLMENDSEHLKDYDLEHLMEIQWEVPKEMNLAY